MTDVLRTPDEWCGLTGILVMDPDGWNRKDPESWYTPITRDEFIHRAMSSTCGAWPHPLKDEVASATTWAQLEVTPFPASMKVEDTPPMLDAALAMFEMFTTLVQAGFTESQALSMVAEMIIKGKQ